MECRKTQHAPYYHNCALSKLCDLQKKQNKNLPNDFKGLWWTFFTRHGMIHTPDHDCDFIFGPLHCNNIAGMLLHLKKE